MSADSLFNDNQLADMMHHNGIRPSVHRLAILSFVANAKTHPSADEIFTELKGRFPSLSRTTIYNSLHTLTDAGLLKELEIDSGNKHYDLAPQPPHSHFICRRCARIFDMPLPDTLQELTSPGFMVDSVDLYYKGLCPQCRRITEHKTTY